MDFSLTSQPIEIAPLRETLQSVDCGGFCSFEGWVRNHHLGKQVRSLEYEAYAVLAVKEGNTVLKEALERFEINDARAVHRIGPLVPGDLAVWVGVGAAHRDAAFEACRYIIDTIKERVPVWKHEFYTDGTDVWVDPTDCSCAWQGHSAKQSS